MAHRVRTGIRITFWTHACGFTVTKACHQSEVYVHTGNNTTEGNITHTLLGTPLNAIIPIVT